MSNINFNQKQMPHFSLPCPGADFPFQQMVEWFPDWAGLYFIKGLQTYREYEEEENTDKRANLLGEAEYCFSEAIKRDEKNYPDFWVARGLVRSYLGKKSDAEEDFRAAHSIDENDLCAILILANFFDIIENQQEAEQLYIKAIELHPDHAMAYSNYACFLLRGNTDSDIVRQSLNLFSKALELEPQNYNQWAGKAHLHKFLGEYDESINCFNEAISLCPTDEVNAQLYTAREQVKRRG